MGEHTMSRNTLRLRGSLVAGSPFVTIANPIDAVLTEFGVALDGS